MKSGNALWIPPDSPTGILMSQMPTQVTLPCSGPHLMGLEIRLDPDKRGFCKASCREENKQSHTQNGYVWVAESIFWKTVDLRMHSRILYLHMLTYANSISRVRKNWWPLTNGSRTNSVRCCHLCFFASAFPCVDVISASVSPPSDLRHPAAVGSRSPLTGWSCRGLHSHSRTVPGWQHMAHRCGGSVVL